MKKGSGAVLLLLYLVGMLILTFWSIFFEGSNIYFRVFSHHNVWGIALLFSIVITILNIFAIYGVISREKWAVKVLYAYFILTFVYTASIYVLGSIDFNLWREMYSGNSYMVQMGADTEALALLFTDKVNKIINVMIIIPSAALYSFFIWIIHKKRAYFCK